MGNPMLRSLLVLGATSVLRHVKANASAPPWLSALVARRPFKVVPVALANKMARVIWALLTKGGTYLTSGATSEAAHARAAARPGRVDRRSRRPEGNVQEG
jgi:transposase